MSAVLAAGFGRPVFEAQAVFRAALDALACPGRPVPLLADLLPPAPLSAELAALALAFADADAPLWLDAPLAAEPQVARYLRFHTGARLATDPAEAAFALVSDPARMPDRSAFAQGTDLYPDRSTTLCLAVEALEGGPPLTLSGPGIRDRVVLRAAGLPASVAQQLAANRTLFPRGVDWLLVARQAVIGIPRSARIEEAA